MELLFKFDQGGAFVNLIICIHEDMLLQKGQQLILFGISQIPGIVAAHQAHYKVENRVTLAFYVDPICNHESLQIAVLCFMLHDYQSGWTLGRTLQGDV